MIKIDDISLEVPTEEYADEIISFKNEMISSGSDFDGCGNLKRCSTAEEWIDGCKRLSRSETCPEGLVVSDTYLAIRESDKRLVGVIDLRHSLDTPVLSLWAGHIGYSVRPCERRKGYAKRMLALNLENCKRLGLKRVMICCYDDNIASEKTIIANGGVYEKTVDVDGRKIKRYWINIEDIRRKHG